jgi:hypothetical protein
MAVQNIDIFQLTLYYSNDQADLMPKMDENAAYGIHNKNLEGQEGQEEDGDGDEDLYGDRRADEEMPATEATEAEGDYDFGGTRAPVLSQPEDEEDGEGHYDFGLPDRRHSSVSVSSRQ